MLNEQPKLVYTDTSAIDGSISRSQMSSKPRAVMQFTNATQSTVSYFTNLYNLSTPVIYKNTKSNLGNLYTINTGIVTIEQSEYIRGGSLLVSLTVTVETGVVNA